MVAVDELTHPVQPLLPLSPARARDESRLAADIAGAYTSYRRRAVRLVLACLVEYTAGLSTMALGFRIYGGDLAQVVFDAGLLIALCGPVWTVLLTLWLEDNG